MTTGLISISTIPAWLCLAQGQPQPRPPQAPWSDQETAIRSVLRGLRQVPDDQRASVTRKLAIDIRGLPRGSAHRLGLASGLASLATEGDYGRDTLAEVGKTLAAALRETPIPLPSSGEVDESYLTLAQLAHYESVPVTLDDPSYAAALKRLDESDRKRAAADFTLTDLDGKSWRLRDLNGQVVLVNFWATWCPPCRKEMPDLDVLYQKHRKKGLVVLALSDEDAAKVKPFLEQHRYSFPILLDAGRGAAKSFDVEGIPRSFLFDRNGQLIAQAIDMRTRRQFEAMLKKAGL